MSDPHLDEVDRYMDPKQDFYWVSFSGGMSVQAPDKETAVERAWDFISDEAREYLMADAEMDGK